MASKLDPTQAPGAELIRVIRDRLKEAIRAGSHRGEPVAIRIHTARTSGKKARAALRLLRSEHPKRHRRENHALRDATRKLSALRDVDAMLASFDALLKHHSVPRRGFAPVRLALLHHRGATTPAVAASERTLRAFAKHVRHVRHRLKHWQPDLTFETLLADFIHAYRKARGALRTIQRAPSSRHFHEWRKATKTVYYQCRVLRDVWKPAIAAHGEELRRLGALLGSEHDLTVLRLSLRDKERSPLPAPTETKRRRLLELLSSRRDHLRADAVSLGVRIYARTPGALALRLRRCAYNPGDKRDYPG